MYLVFYGRIIKKPYLDIFIQQEQNPLYSRIIGGKDGLGTG